MFTRNDYKDIIPESLRYCQKNKALELFDQRWCAIVARQSLRDIAYFTENHTMQSCGSGVMTRPVWELMNRLPMFKDAQCGDLTNSEWIADRLVNISSSVII